MDVAEAIRKRRSVRAYRKETLPEDKLEKILEAANKSLANNFAAFM